MATIFLVEGPVAGKSTFASKLSLSNQALHLDLDQWMVTLFSEDRPQVNFIEWYTTCKQRCIEQIWKVATDVMALSGNVVLELGLVQKLDREAFYERVDRTNHELKVYLLDTPFNERWRRVQQRNSEQAGTFKMQVSEEMFQLANSFWEEPEEREIRERDIEFV